MSGTIRSTPLEGLINTPMKVCLNPTERNWDSVLTYYGIVYNHVLKLNLQTLRWELVDNYGDIPGVRMGSRSYF